LTQIKDKKLDRLSKKMPIHGKRHYLPEGHFTSENLATNKKTFGIQDPSGNPAARVASGH
jgi:hypothetical protein